MRRTYPYTNIVIGRTDTGSFRLTGNTEGSQPSRSNRITSVHHVLKRLACAVPKRRNVITYQLEVSVSKPTQFRVSVVHGDRDLPPSNDFLFIGIYDTPEELTDALEPYLQMEEGS